MTSPVHLQPTAPLAERVLLPGDPGRALRLAQRLLAEPKMFNHHRGLWGYTGTSALDEEPLTIQSTGMGGPSAAIVISELADLGARRLVRVGTGGALQASLELGELVVVEEAVSADGTSRALGAGERIRGAENLTAALAQAAGPARRGTVVSTDLFYDPSSPEPGWAGTGALAVEMETATLFTLASLRQLEAGAILALSDLLLPERRRIHPEVLEQAEVRLGQVAAVALLP